MNKKLKMMTPILLGATLMLTGCNFLNKQAEPKQAQQEQETSQQAKEVAQIMQIQALNAMTLQVTFSEALTEEAVKVENLDAIKKDYTFNHNLSIVNVPRLKIGSQSTYIVPVTVQQSDTTYTLSYKGGEAQIFEGSDEKINVSQTKQVTNDTFEIESFKEQGVTDYANIIEAYREARGDQSFQVNDENKDESGKQYQVISSLRDRVVTLTADDGEEMQASYVLFTQAADGRQAPKFRLPEGRTLRPGVQYTVTSDWATVANPTFTATEIAPLTIKAVEPIDDKSFQVTLDKDPGMELFAGRSVELQGEDGKKIQAKYRYSSRKGAVGIFDVKEGTLKSGGTYRVEPLNNWATAANLTLKAK
ncbi:hypothetical protein [Lysinibacillus sphaericus]|uniref:S-layer domain-containing protein n=2 Tax=Lysinibacillus TaxID=400634 RepID=R7ZDG6_LYSSH|nr:hypothetical protein [Lysinibacillus sphaericus]EON72128.1 S-layer domain-containing protein [Lysinibacillus sphaericus OT4b.31]